MAKKRRRNQPPTVARSDAAPAETVFFHSDRATTLYGVALLAWLPVPLTAWLLSLPMPPGEGWDTTPVGPTLWWLLPALLGALTLAMPAAMAYLHDRYVLRFERTEAGLWRITTWLHWGRRVREFSSAELAGAQAVDVEGRFNSRMTVSVNAPYLRVRLPSGRRLIFDGQGEAALGWAALEAVFEARSER